MRYFVNLSPLWEDLFPLAKLIPISQENTFRSSAGIEYNIHSMVSMVELTMILNEGDL